MTAIRVNIEQSHMGDFTPNIPNIDMLRTDVSFNCEVTYVQYLSTSPPVNIPILSDFLGRIGTVTSSRSVQYSRCQLL